MPERRGMPWLGGLAALAIACLGLAGTIELQSAALFHEADEYYRSLTGTDPYALNVSAYWEGVWRMSSGLHEVVSPLLAGGVLATLALVSALAVGWERRDRSRA